MSGYLAMTGVVQTGCVEEVQCRAVGVLETGRPPNPHGMDRVHRETTLSVGNPDLVWKGWIVVSWALRQYLAVDMTTEMDSLHAAVGAFELQKS